MINKFREEYGYLSNFYTSPIIYHKVTFPTVEHFYQLHKHKFKKDLFAPNLITLSASNIKAFSKTIDIREDFKSIKNQVMYNGLFLKFTQNPELGLKLISTYPLEIVEGNDWHDTYWGKCKYKDVWVGENWLGILLMKIRDYLVFKYTPIMVDLSTKPEFTYIDLIDYYK